VASGSQLASDESEPAEPKGKRAKMQQEGLGDLAEDEIDELDQNELQCAVTMLEEKLKQLKPNMAAIREYRKKEQDYLSRVQDLDAVTAERDELRRHFEVPFACFAGAG
jgi:structural maintenance of chromosome 4